MTPQEKLQQLGITLPPVSAPAAAYVPFVRSGNLVFLSGHIARKDGKPWVGQLGKQITTEDGKQAARAVAIDLMGTLQAAVGRPGQGQAHRQGDEPGQLNARLHRAAPGHQRLLRAAGRSLWRQGRARPQRLRRGTDSAGRLCRDRVDRGSRLRPRGARRRHGCGDGRRSPGTARAPSASAPPTSQNRPAMPVTAPTEPNSIGIRKLEKLIVITRSAIASP